MNFHDGGTRAKSAGGANWRLIGAFGARNVPAIMKAIDILGMKQAREWDVATLNEVRKFFKLKPHATFRKLDLLNAISVLYGF